MELCMPITSLASYPVLPRAVNGIDTRAVNGIDTIWQPGPYPHLSIASAQPQLIDERQQSNVLTIFILYTNSVFGSSP